MRRVIVGFILAAGLLAASVAHAVVAYLPIEYGTGAPSGAYRLKVSTATDSTYLQQYMGGTWVTRTAFKNGVRPLFDLPASYDSTLSRLGSGSDLDPKRYKVTLNADSTIGRPGSGVAKSLSVNEYALDVETDSSLFHAGNNTSAAPKYFGVDLSDLLNADSTIARTGTGSRTSVKKIRVPIDSSLTRAGTGASKTIAVHLNSDSTISRRGSGAAKGLAVPLDSTLTRMGSGAAKTVGVNLDSSLTRTGSGATKHVAVSLAADSTVRRRGAGLGKTLGVPFDSSFAMNVGGQNIQTRYDSTMSRYGAAASKTVGVRLNPDSTIQRDSEGLRVPVDSSFIVSTGDAGFRMRIDSTFSRYGAAASKTIGLKLATYNNWTTGLQSLKVDFDDSTATGAWRFHSDVDTLRLRYGTTGSFVTRWTFRPGTDLNRFEASHQAADNTNQRGAFTLRHYDIQEEPMIGVFLKNSTAGEAEVNIGGGASQGNATEEVNLYTAGNTTTTTGTLRMSVDSTGVLIGATKVNLGSIMSMNADSSLQRTGSNAETAPKKLAVNYANTIVAPADSSLKRTGGNSAASPKVLAVNPAMMTRAQADSTLDTTGDGSPASPKLLGINLATQNEWSTTQTFPAIEYEAASNEAVTVQPDVSTASWSLTLPPDNGDPNEFLQTDGAGVATWVAALTAEVDGVIGNEVIGAADSSLQRTGNGTGAVPFKVAVNYANTIVGPADSTLLRTGGNSAASPKVLKVNIAIQNAAGDSTLIRAGNGTGSAPKTLKVRLASDSTLIKTDNATGLHVNPAIQAVATDSTLVRVGNGTAAVPKGLRVRVSSDSTIIREGLVGLHVNPVIQNVNADSTLVRAGDGTATLPKTLAVDQSYAFNWTGAQTWASTMALSGGAGIVVCVSDTIGKLSPSVTSDAVPAGATLLYATGEIIEVFNATVTNVLEFGYSGDDDAYITAAALDETATGLTFIRPDVGTTSPTAAPKTVVLKYSQTGDAATTGLARLSLWFLVKP